MTNNWGTYECSTKFCSYVTTGTVFEIALRCRGYSLQWGEWEILLGENGFSLVTNSSLKLKTNICILELSILLPKNLLFLYYIQVIRFGFFLRKIDLSSYVLLFYLTLKTSLIWWWYHIYMIQNSFFPKIEKAFFTDQFHLLIFF